MCFYSCTGLFSSGIPGRRCPQTWEHRIRDLDFLAVLCHDRKLFIKTVCFKDHVSSIEHVPKMPMKMRRLTLKVKSHAWKSTYAFSWEVWGACSILLT